MNGAITCHACRRVLWTEDWEGGSLTGPPSSAVHMPDININRRSMLLFNVLQSECLNIKKNATDVDTSTASAGSCQHIPTCQC